MTKYEETGEASVEKKTAKSTSAKKSKGAAPVAIPAQPQVFAIVRTGGKQYRVSPGVKISVEKLEAEVGASVTFSEVLMAGMEGGADVKVSAEGSALGVTVTGRVVGQVKEKKVIIFKKSRRAGYTKKQGHRQKKTEVIIDNFSL